jgi:hypothetical protein
LVGVAVKVVLLPAQIDNDGVLMITDGVTGVQPPEFVKQIVNVPWLTDETAA